MTPSRTTDAHICLTSVLKVSLYFVIHQLNLKLFLAGETTLRSGSTDGQTWKVKQHFRLDLINNFDVLDFKIAYPNLTQKSVKKVFVPFF